MSDLISREAARNAVRNLGEDYVARLKMLLLIEELPSAEPEQKRAFLGIDVSYPAICTYPEYEGKPYYAIKYLEDGETIVGFGTYKPDVLSEYLQKYFIPSSEVRDEKNA